MKTLAERLYEKSQELDWDERGIVSGDPEVKIVLDILDLQIRVEKMEGKKGEYETTKK